MVGKSSISPELHSNLLLGMLLGIGCPSRKIGFEAFYAEWEIGGLMFWSNWRMGSTLELAFALF
jgi:hypothetical protein